MSGSGGEPEPVESSGIGSTSLSVCGITVIAGTSKFTQNVLTHPSSQKPFVDGCYY